MSYQFITDVAKEVHKGDIFFKQSDIVNLQDHINIYIGNGLIGGCIDYVGGMNNFDGKSSICKTYLSHKYHYTKASYGMEFRVPLCVPTFDIMYEGYRMSKGQFEVKDYTQHLDIYNGLLSTDYSLYLKDNAIAKLYIEQWMSQYIKNAFLTRITVEPLNANKVELQALLKGVSEFISHYRYPYKGQCNIIDKDSHFLLTVKTNAITSQIVYILDDGFYGKEVGDKWIKASYTVGEKQAITIASIVVSEKENVSLDNVLNRYKSLSFDQHFNHHKEWWHSFWNESLVSFACDYPLMIFWLRSNYYFAITEASFKSVPITPGGLTGSDCWPYFFPQDYWYVYQNYLSCNHKKLMDATATYWYDILDDVKAYTRMLLNTDGAFYPWSPPYFDYSEYHKEGVPNRCYYELHNSAYVLQMCYQYYLYTGDIDYLRQYGYPVIKEVANFYAGISSFNEKSGKYDITFKPNMGQDEMGGFNKENYMCTLTSALYSVKVALEVCKVLQEQPDERWKRIADKGYDFEKLVRNGVYVANAELERLEGDQKHPVQLNSIAYLPLKEIYERQPFLNTYYHRYYITDRARENYWHGWTLGTFLLASARVGDAEETEKDFKNLYLTASSSYPYYDKDFIQIYETSGKLNMAYYITTHGLVTEAITELMMQVYRGFCDVFPVLLPSMKNQPVIFENLATPFGYTVSGRWSEGQCRIIIKNNFGKYLKIRINNVSESLSMYNAMGAKIAESRGNSFIEADIQPGEQYLIISK